MPGKQTVIFPLPILIKFKPLTGLSYDTHKTDQDPLQLKWPNYSVIMRENGESRSEDPHLPKQHPLAGADVGPVGTHYTLSVSFQNCTAIRMKFGHPNCRRSESPTGPPKVVNSNVLKAFVTVLLPTVSFVTMRPSHNQ